MSQATAIGGFASARVGLGFLGVRALRASLSHVPRGREGLCGLASSM